MLLEDLGKARGCSTNTFAIHSLIDSLTDPLVPTSLRRRHAQTVRYRTFGYKIDSLNPKGHQNPIGGSKVMAIY